MPKVLDMAASIGIFDEVDRARVKKHYGVEKVICFQCQKLIRLSSWIAFKKVNTIKKIELFKQNGTRSYPRIYHLKCFTRMWN